MVRTTFYLGSFAILCSAVKAGLEINMLGVASSEEYTSGAVMAKHMKIKEDFWDAEREAGLFDSALYPELGYTKCVNGFAAAIPGNVNQTFRCNNIDLYHFLSHEALGSNVPGMGGSSSWGWTSEGGREFVAIGQYDGTAFAEITSQGKLSYLGRLPSYDRYGARWREIRVLRHYAVIGTEAIEAGVQFFDMEKLLSLDPASPTTFTQDDLTGHWGWDTPNRTAWERLPVGRTHNVVVNTDVGYAVAVGSVNGNETHRIRVDMPCNGGLIFINTTDITNPTSSGCAAGDGYVHDAECLIYHGPDKRYEGRDICYGYNEDTLTIYDVTNKIGNTTTIIARVSYVGARYIHQGAVLDTKNQEFLVLDDELDEVNKDGPAANELPTTHIFDIRNLEKPIYTGNYQGKKKAIDHNQYIRDGFIYQSNYGNGMTVYDVRSIPRNPTGSGVCEAGFFDTHPEDDTLPGGGAAVFTGSWSSYAMFKSGFIMVHTIERGTFVVKMTGFNCPKAPTCHADNCLRALRANSIPGRLEESQAFCEPFLARQVLDERVVKDYARKACTQAPGLIPQVSSACSCIPSATPAP